MYVNSSFSAVGNGGKLALKFGESLKYSITGTFSATVVLEKSVDGGQSWTIIATKTAAASDVVKNENSSKAMEVYRFRCTARSSGTVVTVLAHYDYADVKKLMVPAAGLAKAGATAGFVVAAGDDIALVTCPASQTASTCVLPLVGLKPGDQIVGFYLVGQIESGGNTATLDAVLKKHTAAAADVAVATVASMTQISATADTLVDQMNSVCDGFLEVVDTDETYFVLLTATTAAATDVALQGVTLLIKEA